METLRNQTFPQERALYAAQKLKLINCTFDGEEDGESALKESRHIWLDNCYMNLRYPLWHDRDVTLTGSEMTEKCRAPLWYSTGIRITGCTLNGVKALRECRGINIDGTSVGSPEFGWRSRRIRVNNSRIQGEYPFFMSRNITFNASSLTGKYSFQYCSDVVVEDSTFDTKDAFWHTKNVTIRNSVIKGEYLAWYSDGLTLDHCRISGTQPLCYCKNLKLIDCEMVDADLAFEYSDVHATVNGRIESVKNPLSGSIAADEIGEIIITADSVYPCRATIRTRTAET